MMTSSFLTTFRWPTYSNCMVNIKLQAGIVVGWVGLEMLGCVVALEQ